MAAQEIERLTMVVFWTNQIYCAKKLRDLQWSYFGLIKFIAPVDIIRDVIVKESGYS